MSPFKPFAHLEYINDLRSRLPQPLRYNLSDSCGETLTFGQLLALDGQDSLDELPLGYASIQGDEQLRQSIAALYRANSSEVATFCGAQEALFTVFNHLIKPGDEVINLSPAYPSILTVPQQLGAKVKSVHLSYDRQWQFNIDDIKANLSDKTRLIVLNSPHNPTGSVMSVELAQQILELAEQRGIYIVSDEVSVWSDYNDKGLNYPFLQYDRAIVIGVMSKSLGLAGVRVGWAVCKDKSLLGELMNIKGYLSICGSATDEYLATIALKHFDTIVGNNNRQIKRNIELFEDFIAQSKGTFEWHRPQAGILTLVKANLDISIRQLAEDLAFEKQLLILPGDLFGINGEYFRLGLGRANFAQALERLSEHLKT